jgi:molybdopterin-synthase adenylyltransferase
LRLARGSGIDSHNFDIWRLGMSEGNGTSEGGDGLPMLDETERAVCEWQMWADGVGELGQRKLKAASVLISRIGGVGGTVAYQLAAAGVGKLILAHAGNIKQSDLNRQLLMNHDGIGESRVETAKARLLAFNPRLNLEIHNENVDETNAMSLVSRADIVVDCAPLFAERFAMNRAIVQQGKPMVECAMYEFEASLTTILPGTTACLACLSPIAPTAWRREFPVFGAVAGTVACLAAMEVIKLITGVGESLAGNMLAMDLANMTFSKRKLHKNPNCEVCKEARSDGKKMEVRR